MDFTPYRYPRDPFPSDMPLPPAPPEAMEAYKKRLEYSQRIFDPWDASYAPPQPQTEDPGPSTNKKAQRAESSKPKHKKNDDIHPTSRDAQRNNVQGQIEQVQRVLVEPDRTGWARISDMVHKYDEDRIRDVKEDIDTLLVFAGLFSAVLTAFLIETYTTLKTDSGDATSEILLQISSQLASLTVAGSFINSTIPAFSIPSFVAPQSSVRINTLWSCSLAFALITASLAILVKQWFHEYMSHETGCRSSSPSAVGSSTILRWLRRIPSDLEPGCWLDNNRGYARVAFCFHFHHSRAHLLPTMPL
ncbi:hypothetical protein QCA50_006131 [Cerrena zonata]|uniref:DUF6535 domain-containing protein n=1 Tax=Cerrena zonata TaxID=2478898 RepID=A0AAW0GBW5_9APHY